VELAIRLWKRGFHFRFVVNAIAYQIVVWDAKNLVRKQARRQGREYVLLSRKHPEYRPFSPLANLGAGGSWKSFIRGCAIRLPVSPEPLLRPFFALANAARRLGTSGKCGLRLLEYRRYIELIRSAAREAGSWGALENEFGRSVPILLYHHVGSRKSASWPRLTVTAPQFAHQIR
jgi:hypothetical protein